MKKNTKVSKVEVISPEVEAAAGFATAPVKKPADIKKKTISRTDALNLMKNNGGRFFSAVFVTKKDKLRTINGQYLKDQGPTDLGYVKVVEAGRSRKKEEAIRNVNLQTLEMLRIGGKTFNVG